MPSRTPTKEVVKVKTKRLSDGTIVRVTFYRKTRRRANQKGK